MHGKIVICLVNDPGLRDSTIFEGKVLTYYGRWTYKIEEAARHGAAGILMIHTTESATYPWSAVTSSWTGEQVRLEQPPTSLLAAGWIRDSAAAALFHDGGQDLDRLTGSGLDPEVQAGAAGAHHQPDRPKRHPPFAHGQCHREAAGRGPHAREAIVIGGHYDHFGIRDAGQRATRSTTVRSTTPPAPPRSSRWRRRSPGAGSGPGAPSSSPPSAPRNRDCWARRRWPRTLRFRSATWRRCSTSTR